jgi:hypothetical protein
LDELTVTNEVADEATVFTFLFFTEKPFESMNAAGIAANKFTNPLLSISQILKMKIKEIKSKSCKFSCS